LGINRLCDGSRWGSLITYKTDNFDFNELCELIQEFIEESDFKVEVNRSKISMILNSDFCFPVVAYDDDKPVGVIIGYIYEHPLFKAKCSDDFLLYVKNDYRGKLVSVKLVKMYKNWAITNSVDFIFISQSTGVGNVDRIKQFYNKLGFKTVGFNCVKGI
jgi:GNAT superfamily N-acetyltransferase